jgi:polar amino acid transport system substrate-binding protein
MNVHRRVFLHVLAAASIAIAGCATVATAPDPASTKALAPTGKLRVGLYPGTPTSIVGDLASGNARGVGYDLGKELAARAGLPFEPVVFTRNAEVLAAAKAGSIDMVFTNATTPRMAFLDFSRTVFHAEQGYLVPSGSALQSAAEVDRAGVRVGVSEGSTSEGILSRELAKARVVRTASLKAATDMLAAGNLDVFATNKPTLFEVSDELSGSRVLPGRYGLENFAIGIPKGREAALPFVNRFVEEAKGQGLVTRAIERAGLRGTLPAD